MTERAPDGKLLPGHSVVPKRRSGKGGGLAEATRKHLEPHRKEVLDKLAALAKAGDGKSITEYLNRTVGVARAEDEKVVIAGLSSASTVQEKAAAVLAAVASGQCTVNAGHKLISMVELVSRVVTLAEFEERLLALEGRRASVVQELA